MCVGFSYKAHCFIASPLPSFLPSHFPLPIPSLHFFFSFSSSLSLSLLTFLLSLSFKIAFPLFSHHSSPTGDGSQAGLDLKWKQMKLLKHPCSWVKWAEPLSSLWKLQQNSRHTAVWSLLYETIALRLELYGLDCCDWVRARKRSLPSFYSLRMQLSMLSSISFDVVGIFRRRSKLQRCQYFSHYPIIFTLVLSMLLAIENSIIQCQSKRVIRAVFTPLSTR